MNPDPDPSILVIDLQDANKKLIFFTKLSCLILFEGTVHHVLKINSQKEVTKQ
jgi:hypothetical protein